MLEDRRVLSTFTVTTAFDEFDFSNSDLSLREAIEQANAGPGADSIQFDPGLAGQPILLTLGELSIEESVTLTGLGSGQTIVDAQDGSRVLNISGGDVCLERMTVTRGLAPGSSKGGAIFNTGTLAITHSVISSSRSNSGGGIYNEGTLKLENSTVSDNESIGGFTHGGGIFNTGTATITDSVISSNESGVGGGIRNDAGATLTICGSQFTQNVAHMNPGGGIYNEGALSIASSFFSGNRALDGGAISTGGLGAVMTLSDSILSGNRAQWEGGGIDNFGEATITRTTLSHNIATKYFGGAIANSNGTMSLVDSTISANDAGSRGGGIENWCSSLTITNSTISGNTAGDAGGAIRNQGWDDPHGGQADVTLNNVTIAGNSGASGAGIYHGKLADLTIANSIIANGGSSADVFREGENTLTLVGVNLVQDGSISGPGVINANPLLAPLADNGGPTLTHALISGSPAVNAGDNSVLPPDVTDADNDGDTGEPIPFDQRGEGFDRILDAIVDLGAFEGEIAGGPVPVLYFALDKSASGGGVSAADEDIIQLDDQGNFAKVFDGSDVGVGALKLDAFSIISDTEILMSFTAPGMVGGMSVDDSDVVLFTATSLGEDTAGSWSMYFDGSSFGLTTNNENVDAVELLPNGHLLISTTGNVSVPGVSGADEDLLEFAPATGSWSMFFDGSDVGLATSSDEDVNALGRDEAGNVYLSTVGNFAVPGVSGADEDVFVFQPTSLGWNTAGTFDPDLYFDGSAFGLAGRDLFAIDIPTAGQSAGAMASAASPSPRLSDAALLAYLAAESGTPEKNDQASMSAAVLDFLFSSDYRSMVIDTGGGANAVTVQSALVLCKTTIDTAWDHDTVALRDSIFGGDALADGGLGDDLLRA